MKRWGAWQWAYLITILMATVAFALLLVNNNSVSNESSRTAQQAEDLAEQIQQQRREFIRRDCEDQNQRHLDLEDYLRGQKITRAERPEVFAFVDALAPVRDCDKVVKDATTVNGK